jgi:K+/H+ antiporter YhaU regulatory subunit KhtT
VLLPTGSMLAGSTLRDLRFRQRFDATVLAVIYALVIPAVILQVMAAG